MNTPIAAALPGTPLRLGAREVVMPALNLRLAREHWATVEAMQVASQAGPEHLGRIVALVAANLRRNHPDLTDAEAEDGLDLDNLPRFSAALLGNAAFKRWLDEQAREQAALGNAPALQPPSPGTGAPSSPPSPPAPAGASGPSAS